MRARRSNPETWEDLRAAGLSPLALLINDRARLACDSQGVVPTDPAWLRSRLLPVSDVRTSEVAEATTELVKKGLLTTFDHESATYGLLTGFTEDGGSQVNRWPAPPVLIPAPALHNGATSGRGAPASGAESRANPRQSAPGGVGESGPRLGTRLDSTLTDGSDSLGKGDRGKPLSALLTAELDVLRATRKLPHSIDTRRTGLALSTVVEKKLHHLRHYPALANEKLPQFLAVFVTEKLRFINARKTKNPAAYIVSSFPKWIRENDALYITPPKDRR